MHKIPPFYKTQTTGIIYFCSIVCKNSTNIHIEDLQNMLYLRNNTMDYYGL